jgi:hypothetical protein
MKQMLLASTAMLAFAVNTQAQTLQSGTIDGMLYDLLPASGGCSAATPCSIVTYLSYMDETTQATASDVQSYFGGAFAQANPHTVVIAPMITTPQSGTVSWGGYVAGPTQSEQQAVAVVQAVERQMGGTVNTRDVAVTGGSLGGDGTQAMLADYGRKGVVQPGIFSAGLSFDAAFYAATPAQMQALCGVPLMAVHGTADTNQSFSYDQSLASTPSNCGSFTLDPIQGAGHGTWSSSAGYSAGMGTGTPLSWLTTRLQTGGASNPAGTANAVTPRVTAAATPSPTPAAAVTPGLASMPNRAPHHGRHHRLPQGTGSPVGAALPAAAQPSPGQPAETAWTAAPTASSAVGSAASTATPAPTLTPQSAAAASGQTCEAVTASAPVSDGTRDPTQAPFAADSVFNLPLGLNAQWQQNAQLQNAGVFVNTAGNYNENIYTGTESDPLVTVTNTAGAGGTPGTYQVHIPANAVPSGGGDHPLSVDDTTTHTWYSFGGFQWTGPNSAIASQGSGESDIGSGIEVANSNWDEGVGTLRQRDLTRGTINHMLRMELPTDMLMSYSGNTNQLAPYAWPQTAEDGFAVSGNGGAAYSGTVPYGVTIGIPALAQEPAAVAANPGADLLWRALQDHGAMVRDSGGSGNTVIFQADQDVSPGDPVIQGMQQLGQQVMQYAMILTNQGPNSINGGGTPIIPMDGPGAVAVAGNAATGLCSTPGNVASNLTIDQLAIVAASNTPPATFETAPPGTMPAPTAGNARIITQELTAAGSGLAQGQQPAAQTQDNQQPVPIATPAATPPEDPATAALLAQANTAAQQAQALAADPATQQAVDQGNSDLAAAQSLLMDVQGVSP